LSSIAKISRATPAVSQTILGIMADIRGGDQEAAFSMMTYIPLISGL